MNKVMLVGNICKNPEQRTTQSGIPVTSFTVAVNRRFKNADGTQQTDYINCVAWRSTAEFIGKYFSKGMKIGIVGSIQSRSYDDKDGNRRYVTEVVVDEAEFVTSKGDKQKRESYDQPQPDYDYAEDLEPLGDDTEGLPF